VRAAPLILALLALSSPALAKTERTPAGGVARLRLLSSSASFEVEAAATDQLEVESDEGPAVSRDGDQIAVKARGSDRVRIKLPPGLRVEALTASGDIKLRGRYQRIELKSASGSFDLDVDAERLDLESISGDIRLRSNARALSVRATSGDVRLDGGRGEIRVNSTSGDLHLVHVSPDSLDLHTVSGTIECSTEIRPDARFELRTISGDVRLGVIGPGGFRLEAKTRSGEIELSKELTGTAAIRARGALGQQIAGGGADLHVITLSGSVRIDRSASDR
jgi:DUF4097 and DUF4098 domain-containing protein YvlB